jgi:hypothetical protein
MHSLDDVTLPLDLDDEHARRHPAYLMEDHCLQTALLLDIALL